MRRHDAKLVEPLDAFDLGSLKQTLDGLDALWRKSGIALDGTLRLYGAGDGNGEITLRFYLNGPAEKYMVEVRQ